MPVGQETTLDTALEALAAGRNRDPFAVLGPHPRESGRGATVRAFQPSATAIDILLKPFNDVRPMQRRQPPGVFEIELGELPEYRLRITYPAGPQGEVDDPYRYGRVLTDFDLHLLGEGTHHRAFEKLGAHRTTIGSTTGVHFAVWAPNADRVSVIGDFNAWDGRVPPMRTLTPTGVWEIFIPA